MGISNCHPLPIAYRPSLLPTRGDRCPFSVAVAGALDCTVVIERTAGDVGRGGNCREREMREEGERWDEGKGKREKGTTAERERL
jgi:hypothetical protein